MKGRLALSCLFLVPVLFLANFRAEAATHLNDPTIARKLNITVQELKSLREKFELENDQVLELTRIQLETMLEQISRPGVDKHAEEFEFRAKRMRDENGEIPIDGLPKAIKKKEKERHGNPHDLGEEEEDLFPGLPDPSTNMPSFGDPGAGLAGIGTNAWTWIGPGNIGGRVRSILIHPSQTNIMWCGGVDGGVWKSTNSGTAWFPLNDFMANLAISCMVMSPTNPNVIYAGTGESTYNVDAIRGAGIFKTTDGGSNWVQLSATANTSYQFVSKVAMDLTGQILLAATRSGIFRSVDGGASFSQRSSTEMRVVAFSSVDSTNCIASGYGGRAFYSTNAGLTWFQATGLPTASGINGRVEVAYARSVPGLVYASADSSGGQIYASADGGQTYTLRSTGYSYLGSQGWYDNALWIDPTSTNILVVGGIDLWRSVDGGATLNRISQWQSAPSSAHADHHMIIENPAYNGTTVKTVYFGDDGGVYRANDITTVSLTSGWQSLNNNLGITQFYGGSGNPTSGVVVGGTQDNGTLRYTIAGGTGGWTAMFGGDGGFAASDQGNQNYHYGEYVYLQIHRSVNGGASSSYIYSGISDAGSGSTANFIAPFILDPNNQNTMLAGGISLWRSTNVKSSPVTWASIKGPTSGNSPISAIAVAPGNPNVIWVGHNNGDVYSTSNGTNTTPTWIQRDLGTPNLPNRYCERIAISPTNSSKAYVTFGGFSSPNVWRTVDSGATWASISAGLPAAPVNAITIAPTSPTTLYIGTEVGIYGSSDDGATWSTGNDGPANVSIDELFWMGSKLVAVTHGRGMYYTTPVLGPPALAAAGSILSGGNGNGQIDPNECNFLNLKIQNVGGGVATNISAVLTTTTPGVDIVRGTATYPNVTSGSLATNIAPFQISTLPSFACGTPVALTLAVTFNGLTNTLAYTIGTPTYVLSQTTGASIVPGDIDTGIHDDDLVGLISLPFNYTFYGQTFSNVTVDSNGKLDFTPADSAFQNTCLPASLYPNSIFPLWDDLITSGSGNGIFYSVSGVAPNRIFNIEWRAVYLNTGLPCNFEARLYEGQQRVDFIYGDLNDNGSGATVGIQKDSSAFTAFECNSGGLSPGLQLTFQPNCSAGSGPCAPFINFTGSPLSGAAPLQVSFANTSGGATNYFWDFGDGNFSSAINPTNTYSSTGTYSVTLTGIGPGGTNSLTRPSYIVVTNPPPKLVVSTISINFGPVFTGLTAQASFVVSNSGAATLNGSASLSAGAFTLLDPSSNAVTTLPFSVLASGTTNIGVAFTPPTVSTFSNSVIFTSNGGNSTNSVTGQGLIAPSLLSPTLTTDGFTFSFDTVTGKTYVIQYKDDLTDPVWQTLQTVPGDGTLKIVTNSTAVPDHRFYRLIAQ